jgi:hypothetical protein
VREIQLLTLVLGDAIMCASFAQTPPTLPIVCASFVARPTPRLQPFRANRQACEGKLGRATNLRRSKRSTGHHVGQSAG